MAILEVLSAAQASGFDAAAATRAYLDAMPADQAARTAAYHEGQIWLILWGALYTIAIYLILLWTGFARGLRNRLEGFMPKWLAPLPFAAVFVLVSSLMSLPINYYSVFLREHQYGLSTMTNADWFSEWGIGLAIGTLMSGLFLWVLYLLIKAFKRTWWLVGTAFAAGFLYVALLLSPIYIAPLFNDYTSLEDGPLRDSILAIAAANDIPADDVYVFTSSDQSNRITANVSGIGSTVRISLGDTLIQQADEDEILAVMAHEMGHYVLGHTYRMIYYFLAIALGGFLFVHFTFGWASRRFGAKWDIQHIGDIAGMPLFFLLFTVYSTTITPVQYNIIRSGEVAADRFGLEVAREPDGFATTALRLSTYRELEPTELEEMLFRHHPSGASRVSMAMEWKARELAAGAEDQTTELRLDRARAIFADSPMAAHVEGEGDDAN